MRVEYLLPLPDTKEISEQRFDTLLDAALAFTQSHPVFTPQQLHTHLLEFFPLSRRPEDFRDCLVSIRDAMQQVADMRGWQAEWTVQSHGGYTDTLHTFGAREITPRNAADQDCLDQYVLAELTALFGGRSEVSERELLFYLHAWQGLGDEAEEVLALLVDDGFLFQVEDSGEYTLAPGPTDDPPFLPPLPPPARVSVRKTVDVPREMVVVDGVRVAVPVRPRPVVSAAPLVVPQPSEVSPPLPDIPFSIEDRSRAVLVLNRLSWEDARADGVPVSVLVRAMDDGTTTLSRRRAIVGRLWRRGYLLRDVRDPNDSIVRLRPDIPEDRDVWPTVMVQIISELGQPFQPEQKPARN